MGWIGDLAGLWDRTKAARRFVPLPEAVQAIQERLTALEGQMQEMQRKIAAPCPASCCERCGAQAARLIHRTLWGPKQEIVYETWECSACGQKTPRMLKTPTAKPAAAT